MKQSPPKNKPVSTSPPITTGNEFPKVIYADRIINAGFGAGVSRLTLAMETGLGTYVTSAIVVLPTPALLEVMNQMLSAVSGNSELKQGIIQALDAFKAQLNALD